MSQLRVPWFIARIGGCALAASVLLGVLTSCEALDRVDALGEEGPPADASAEAPPAAQEPAHVPGRSQPRAARVHGWQTIQPLEPTPFTIFPIADATRLMASWNFEMRELSRRFIPAWMAIGGEVPDVIDSWALYPYVSQEHNSGFMRALVREDGELAELGRQMNTGKVLQVEMSREGRDTIATAWIIDSATGEREAEWSAAVDYRANVYEPIFDAQVKLAPIVAADMLGIGAEELLAVPPIEERLSGEERDRVEAAIAEAAGVLFPPTYPRLLEAYHLVMDALEIDPKNAELWILYTIIQRGLLRQLEEMEAEIRRETMIRMILGGEISLALAPDDPRARLAHGLSLSRSGRDGVAVPLARENHEKYPDSWMDHLWYQVLHWEDEKELAIPEELDDPIAALIRDLKQPHASAMRGAHTVADIYIEYAHLDAFAPHHLNVWVREPSSRGIGLGERRVAAHLMAAQGAMLTILECSRQLARHGHEEEALAMLGKIHDITGGTMPARADHAAFRATREHLTRWFDRGGGAAFAMRGEGLPEGSPQWDLILAARDSRFGMIGVMGSGVATPGPLGRTVSYTPWEATEIAGRLAVDGAIAVYRHYMHALGIRSTGRELLERLDAAFPNDLGVLQWVLRYHRYTRFDPAKVNETNDRIMDVSPTHMPLSRLALTWTYRGEAEMLNRIERLKYWEPFHLPTILYIADQLIEREFFAKAREYAILHRIRDPAGHEGRVMEVRWGTLAENRLPTREEIEAVEKYINPHLGESSDLIIGNLYHEANFIEAAIERYEAAAELSDRPTLGDARRLAELYQMTGQHAKAEAILERHAAAPDSLQSETSALLDIYWMYLRLGDDEKAGEYLLRAYNADSGMGRFMVAQQLWNRLRGRLDEVERVHQRRTARYQTITSHLDYAAFLLSQQRIDEAQEQVDASYERGFNDLDQSWYRMIIHLRRGEVRECEEMLSEMAYFFHTDAGASLQQANFYMYIGDYDMALEFAQLGLSRAREHFVPMARRALANIHLRRGEVDEAAEHIAYVRLIHPSDLTFQSYEAEVLIHRGELDEAEQLLERGLNYGFARSRAMMAEIEYRRGNLQEALELNRLANRLEEGLPESRWLYWEGHIAAELGREEEAREAWGRLVGIFGGEHHEFGTRAKAGLEALGPAS